MASNANDDAFAYIKSQLNSWGLGSLASTVQQFLTSGMSADRVMVELQETTAYKQRFAANETRRKKGLPVLSPAEYLSAETAYRQVMVNAGAPVGFYDKPSDFQKFLENDVSPTEIQGRVGAAQKLVESADPGVRKEFERLYGASNLWAYALDSKRTEELMKKQAQAAAFADAANDQGFSGLSRSASERLADLGVSDAQARQGFGQAQRQLSAFTRLGGVSGAGYTRSDAFEDVFFSDEDAASKRRTLASAERGRFSGSSGLGGSSLSQRGAGSF